MTERDYENRLRGYLERLDRDRREILGKISTVKFLELTDREQQKTDREAGYGQRARVTEDWSDWGEFSCENTWGGPDYHCVFGFEVTVSEKMAGRQIGVSLDTGATDMWNTDNPQILVYVNGELTCAFDINHNEVILSDCAEYAKRYDIRLYAYSNSPKKSNFLYIKIFAVNAEAEALYYDMKAPLEAALLLRRGDAARELLLAGLHRAGDLLDLRETGSLEYLDSLRRAGEVLREEIYGREQEPEKPEVYAIGQTHIDVAWKWPLRQTREKAVRSFSTVLYLMDRYPEYRFLSSQPQLYQYVKEEAPELYRKIQEKVREGRWEPEGAMWLEPDCNLTGGESLIRQILYGKKFFAEEFGVEKQEILWLPDAFGFAGSLPQIMKRSGIRYFMTTKLGWNESDQQPDDTFLWEGIDGSRVLGIFVTTKDYETYPERFGKPVRETTYNGRQNANQIMGTWQNYRNQRINRTTVTLYGFGDGGGGPTAGMLEESRRLTKGIPGVPRVTLAGAGEYFSRLEENLRGQRVNTWYGDLYLEYHRGTFTSMAENKKYNRICEYRTQAAEWLTAMAAALRPAGAVTGMVSGVAADVMSGKQIAGEALGVAAGAVTGAVSGEQAAGEALGVAEGAAAGAMSGKQIAGEALGVAVGAVAGAVSGKPAAELERAWKLLLLNQFHDILPGSAIGEVYEQSHRDYEEILRIDDAVIAAGQAAILAADGYAVQTPADSGEASSFLSVWNPLSFSDKCLIELPGTLAQTCIYSAGDRTSAAPLQRQRLADGTDLLLAVLPAKGYRLLGMKPVPNDAGQKETSLAGPESCAVWRGPVPFVPMGTDGLETPWYRVHWNERGELISLYDREADREVLLGGRAGNCLRVYEDIPKDYDAWNIDSYYELKSWPLEVAEPCRLTEAGGICAVLRTVFTYRKSVVEQTVLFYAHTRRIDFRTTIDWQERQQLLKVNFPLDVVTKKAVCEIPYGVIERPCHKNTSWERAKFEMCAHRFVDLSEAGYGAALLNDGRYGWSVRDSEISLTLLTSGIFPYPEADQGRHTVTYALLPHLGDYRSGNVVREAYHLNWKPMAGPAVRETETGKEAPLIRSFLSFDRENVFADAVKPAERGDGLVIRVYEAYGRNEKVRMKLPVCAGKDVWECDLMENRESLCRVEGDEVCFRIRPFEIKTFLVASSQ